MSIGVPLVGVCIGAASGHIFCGSGVTEVVVKFFTLVVSFEGESEFFFVKSKFFSPFLSCLFLPTASCLSQNAESFVQMKFTMLFNVFVPKNFELTDLTSVFVDLFNNVGSELVRTSSVVSGALSVLF